MDADDDADDVDGPSQDEASSQAIVAAHNAHNVFENAAPDAMDVKTPGCCTARRAPALSLGRDERIDALQ